MVPIEAEKVQKRLDELVNQDIYLHLETTNGAYSESKFGSYIRNGRICFSRGVIKGEDGHFRVGLKMEQGWVYGEWLTDWEENDRTRLLLAGHDDEGRLAVAFQLSTKPF